MSHQFRTVSEVEQIEESKENLEEDQQLLFVQKDSGKSNANQVGRELGVRYVLSGSVRRGNGRVRVNTLLVDAQT